MPAVDAWDIEDWEEADNVENSQVSNHAIAKLDVDTSSGHHPNGQTVWPEL